MSDSVAKDALLTNCAASPPLPPSSPPASPPPLRPAQPVQQTGGQDECEAKDSCKGGAAMRNGQERTSKHGRRHASIVEQRAAIVQRPGGAGQHGAPAHQASLQAGRRRRTCVGMGRSGAAC